MQKPQSIRSRISGTTVIIRALSCGIVALGLAIASPAALAQATGPMVFEDHGRCAAEFPGQAITSSAIEPFSCELTCGVDGVTQTVEVNDCLAQRLYRDTDYRTGAAEFPVLNLEYQTVLDVIDEHGLPQDDMDKIRRVMSYARGSVRSRLYATVVNIAAMDPGLRTPDEQVIAEVYANEVHQMRIEAAEFSIAELQRWEAEGCDFVPIEGFSYEPNPAICADGWGPGDLFTTLIPPPLEDFMAYGIANYSGEFQEGHAALAMAQTAHASVFVAIATSAGIGLAVVASSAALVLTATSAVLPFAFSAVSLHAVSTLAAAIATAGSTTATADAVIAAAGAIGSVIGSAIAVILIIIFAIVVGVIQGFLVFSSADLPDQLDEYLAQTIANPPALIEVVEQETETQELFFATMRSTLPAIFDLNNSSPPAPEWFSPIPDTLGHSLVVTHLDGGLNPIPGSETIVQSIEYKPWNGDSLVESAEFPGTWSARISKGYFVLDRPLGDDLATAMQLSIERLGGDGTNYVTWIVGDQFLSYPQGAAPEDGTLSDSMFFWTPDNQPRRLTLSVDPTPPQVTPLITGTEGLNDWYVSTVLLNWDVTDPESEFIVSSDCVTRAAVTEGIHNYNCTAQSLGGTTDELVTLKLDLNAPSFTAEVTPPPSTAGWNNTNPTVSFTCGDFGPSGPVPDTFCSSTITLINETGPDGNLYSRTATDNAGNTAEASVTVKVDKTNPTIEATTDAAPNAAGWSNADITVSFDCDDALSGIASCTAPQVLNTDGVDQGASGTAVDHAGNSAEASVSGYKIDKTPPQITGSRTPEANAAGWNNTNVTARFECTDLLSGIFLCPNNWVFNAEGAGQSLSGTAQDFAGNGNSTLVDGINIDKTPPTIVGSALPGPNGAGWNNSVVTVHFECNDALSGVDACETDSLLGEGAGQSKNGLAVDRAGNTNSAIVAGVNVDLTPPVVSVATPPDTMPEYLQHETIIADWSASDALSGLAGVPVASAADGTAIDTSVAGELRFEVTAMDNAGNTTTIGHDYIVLSPVDSVGDVLASVEALAASGPAKKKQFNGMLSPLKNALRSLSRNKLSSACSQLDDFIAEVSDATPGLIDAQAAASLIEAVEDIQAISIGCG